MVQVGSKSYIQVYTGIYFHQKYIRLCTLMYKLRKVLPWCTKTGIYIPYKEHTSTLRYRIQKWLQIQYNIVHLCLCKFMRVHESTSLFFQGLFCSPLLQHPGPAGWLESWWITAAAGHSSSNRGYFILGSAANPRTSERLGARLLRAPKWNEFQYFRNPMQLQWQIRYRQIRQPPSALDCIAQIQGLDCIAQSNRID
jgi:hypothetical protein